MLPTMVPMLHMPMLQVANDWPAAYPQKAAWGNVEPVQPAQESPMAIVLTEAGPVAVCLSELLAGVGAPGWDERSVHEGVGLGGRDVCMVDAERVVKLEESVPIGVRGVGMHEPASPSSGGVSLPADLSGVLTDGGSEPRRAAGGGDGGEDPFHSGGDDGDDVDPLALSPEERRKLRNRRAQRKFRERQRVRIATLEEEVRGLQGQFRQLQVENAKLRKENEIVRSVLGNDEHVMPVIC
ncbi:unnamed protein product [Ostreobium quekettii]|uniref:BZIP domain-containing protein n=1 Tax=Ostreobium quekettii TaxID=121088 RepID=A0A8S1J6Q6_9CHLO|nr:unnamed protein product [Ostreobium quekettii]